MAENDKLLTISVDPETRYLTLRYAPMAETPPPDVSAVSASLEAAGLAGCALNASAIDNFAAQAASATEPLEAVIGQQLDGSFDISVSPSRMCAWLTIVPPRGGLPVSEAQIRDAIRARHISHGLHEAELAAALLAGECTDLVIAEGEEPESGIPARFDSLIETLQKHKLDGHENDRIDLRELGTLILVHPGEPLMRRTPPVQGKHGVDVFDREVPAETLPDLPFSRSLPGSAPDENDENLLLATISGAPKRVENGFVVNPLVDVIDVDVATGNIDFDGTLQVTGDIKSGMRVQVTGDVMVHGTIEAAEVIAGGDVVVMGGIIGKADSAVAGSESSVDTAVIKCSGTVQAKFVEHAYIEAAQRIEVEAGIRQSDVTAGESVVIGKPGSNQGHLIGGRTRANKLVRAPTLGSISGVPTSVQVGYNPFLIAERQRTESQRKRRVEEMTKLRQLLDFFEQNPKKAVDGMKEKAENTLGLYEAEVKAAESKLQQLAEQMAFSDDAVIEAPKRIHGGVNVQVGPKLLQVLEDKAGGRIRLVKGQLQIG